ncbi:hypothetical protein PHMEG_00011513 [Phytophthora megakarya]|uniref:MULE transposase domain-containing protein n=1 Tax=Phytophthora megakarya TaxID=4795 RepID=A0A225WCR4_9STRA|nr:hypothetical protein PHMEG_00011513 [Phytophthora megakarya]
MARYRRISGGTYELFILLKVQNDTKIGGHDTIDAIITVVRYQAFNRGEGVHEPFTFGWNSNIEGNLEVGNGAEEKPFLLGFSTKVLLRQADRDTLSFIFCVGTTDTTNQVGYTVNFQESHYAKTLASLRWVYRMVLKKPPLVAYALGAADGAQYNVVETVFGEDCNFKHLMCFYHVIAKIVEYMKGTLTC